MQYASPLNSSNIRVPMEEPVTSQSDFRVFNVIDWSRSFFSSFAGWNDYPLLTFAIIEVLCHLSFVTICKEWLKFICSSPLALLLNITINFSSLKAGFPLIKKFILLQLQKPCIVSSMNIRCQTKRISYGREITRTQHLLCFPFIFI